MKKWIRNKHGCIVGLTEVGKVVEAGRRALKGTTAEDKTLHFPNLPDHTVDAWSHAMKCEVDAVVLRIIRSTA